MDAEAEVKPSGLRLEILRRYLGCVNQQVITHATTLPGLLTALRESTMKWMDMHDSEARSEVMGSATVEEEAS